MSGSIREHGRVPDDGDAKVRAMPGIDGETLRAWRRSRGWDVPEMARQLRHAALETDQKVAEHDGLIRMIYAWERGDHELSERYELLYRKLGAGLAGEDPPGAAAAPGDTPDILDELAGQAVEFGRWAEAANLGSGTVEQMDDAIHRIARDYLASAPRPLLRRAGALASQVFGLLQEHQRLRHTRDLYVTGAKCCAFLAWVAHDLGQPAAAAAHGRTALILAEEAGHRGAQALALCALSKAAYWDGQMGRAGELARRGYECCPPNSTRILLACQEADAMPTSQARDAIGRARQAFEDARQDDDLGGVFSCGNVRLANYSATFHLKAGEPDAALRAADSAVAVQGELVGYGTWGQIHIAAGTACLMKSEPDGTADRLGPVLELPLGQRLATLTARLSTLTPVLTAGRYRADPGAMTLAGRIRSYCDEATGALALPAGEETSE